MTLRQSSSRRSGFRQIHRGREKRIKFAAMSSRCWSFFSTAKALSTSNSYPLVKPSMASFTVRFWSGWGRSFGANFQTSGRTIGFSAMTKRPLTHQSLFDNSWLPKTLQWFPNPTPLFAWPRPLRLFPIPQWNYGWKGVVLTRLGRSTQNRKRLLTHSLLRASRGAWNHGKQAGIAAYIPKGTTSKEMVETRSYGKKLFFYWSNSPNFWVAPHMSL